MHKMNKMDDSQGKRVYQDDWLVHRVEEWSGS